MLRIWPILAFLILPVLEIWLLIQVGSVIGGWQTLGLMIVGSLLGAWLLRREGRRAWAALQSAIRSGRTPDRELADGALVVAGGTLLLLPGFVTDVIGLFFILPVTRPLTRHWLIWFIDRRMRALAARSPYGPLLDDQFGAAGPFGGAAEGSRRVRIVHGEVIDPDVRDGRTADDRVVDGRVIEGRVVDGGDS